MRFVSFLFSRCAMHPPKRPFRLGSSLGRHQIGKPAATIGKNITGRRLRSKDCRMAVERVGKNRKAAPSNYESGGQRFESFRARHSSQSCSQFNEMRFGAVVTAWAPRGGTPTEFWCGPAWRLYQISWSSRPRLQEKRGRMSSEADGRREVRMASVDPIASMTAAGLLRHPRSIGRAKPALTRSMTTIVLKPLMSRFS
jgi:hypothetical protein